jgi:hypothetical protein
MKHSSQSVSSSGGGAATSRKKESLRIFKSANNAPGTLKGFTNSN